MEQSRGYALSIRCLHWLMAACLILLIGAGMAMVYGPWDGKFPPLRGALYDFHRGMGFVIMLLAFVRITFKLIATPPSPLPESISKMQRLAAETVHLALYVSFIVMPIFGWYATNTWGVSNISVFGLFDLPQIAEKNRELGTKLLYYHGKAGIVVGILIILHIGAALHHHFIKKDGLILRMLRT